MPTDDFQGRSDDPHPKLDLGTEKTPCAETGLVSLDRSMGTTTHGSRVCPCNEIYLWSRSSLSEAKPRSTPPSQWEPSTRVHVNLTGILTHRGVFEKSHSHRGNTGSWLLALWVYTERAEPFTFVGLTSLGLFTLARSVPLYEYANFRTNQWKRIPRHKCSESLSFQERLGLFHVPKPFYGVSSVVDVRRETGRSTFQCVSAGSVPYWPVCRRFRKDHGCRTSDLLVNVVTMSGQVDPSHGTGAGLSLGRYTECLLGYGPERSMVEASGTGHVSGSSRGGAHESAADCYRSLKAGITAKDVHINRTTHICTLEKNRVQRTPRVSPDTTNGSGPEIQHSQDPREWSELPENVLVDRRQKDLPPLEIHHRIDHAVDTVDEYLIVAKRNVFTCSPHDCDYRQTFVTVKSGGTNAEIGDRSRLSLSSLRSPFPDPGACLGSPRSRENDHHFDLPPVVLVYWSN
ncbi:hypothetical protein Bbelb_384330 [Branchiostoma belcheri]|nr:hypothetical protein Bbelb_384330 [Branchiostoma belcheri]